MKRRMVLQVMCGTAAIPAALAQTPTCIDPPPLTTTVTRQTFVSQAVTLDAARFHNCRFERCTLIYSGGPIDLQDNVFDSCQFQLEGPARRTHALLSELSNAVRMPVEKKKEGGAKA